MPSVPGTTNYPATLDDHTSLLQRSDLAVTKLADPDVNATDTSFTLLDASKFPSAGAFTIEGEHVIYTTKVGNTLSGTVVRGAFTASGGLPASPHPAGAEVRMFDSAQYHEVLVNALVAVETKLGTGADTSALGEFLKGTGAGASAWSALTSGEVTTALGFTPGDAADTADDVEGPSASTDGEVALFSGTTGKAIKRSNTLSGFLQVASGVASAAALTLGQITTALGYTPVNKAGDTMTGNLDIAKATPRMSLTASSGIGGILLFLTGTGGWYWLNNVGDYVLQAVDSAGAFIGNWIQVARTTGAVTLPNLAGTGSRVVEANASGVLSASKLLVTDIIYSGALGSPATSFSLPNNTFTSTYAHYLIKLSNVALATAGQGLWWRGRTSGVDDSGAGSYRSSAQYISETGTSVVGGSASTLGIIMPAIAGGTIGSSSCSIWVENPANASLLTQLEVLWAGVYNGVAWENGWSAGSYSTAKAHDALTFWAGSGNISSLTVEVWGIRTS